MWITFALNNEKLQKYTCVHLNREVNNYRAYNVWRHRQRHPALTTADRSKMGAHLSAQRGHKAVPGDPEAQLQDRRPGRGGDCRRRRAAQQRHRTVRGI